MSNYIDMNSNNTINNGASRRRSPRRPSSRNSSKFPAIILGLVALGIAALLLFGIFSGILGRLLASNKDCFLILYVSDMDQVNTLENLEIHIHEKSPEGEELEITYSEEMGAYITPVDRKSYYIQVSATGYQTAEMQLQIETEELYYAAISMVH